jgi:hypothetical protein
VTQTKEPPLTIGDMSTMKWGARGGPVTDPPRALHTAALISTTETARAQEATNIAISWLILRPATPGPAALRICLVTPLLTPFGASLSTLADSLGDFAVTLIGASLPAPSAGSFGHTASASAPLLHIGNPRMGPWSATGTQPWK